MSPLRPSVRLSLALLLVPLCPGMAVAGPAEQCARVGNDDTIRPYDPALRAGLIDAYARLFPQARMPPDQRELAAGTHIRCMDGRLLACFTGANLPCARMNTQRDNQGAAAYCRTNPDAPFVPAFATGHDTAYTYRCAGGRASVSGETFKLDPRGFAASLWAPIK